MSKSITISRSDLTAALNSIDKVYRDNPQRRDEKVYVNVLITYSNEEQSAFELVQDSGHKLSNLTITEI